MWCIQHTKTCELVFTIYRYTRALVPKWFFIKSGDDNTCRTLECVWPTMDYWLWISSEKGGVELAKECREDCSPDRSVPTGWHKQIFPSSPTSWSKWVKYPRILYLYSVYIYSGEWFGCCNVRKQRESVALLTGGKLFWDRERCSVSVSWGVSDVVGAFRAWGSKALPRTDIHSMVHACP